TRLALRPPLMGNEPVTIGGGICRNEPFPPAALDSHRPFSLARPLSLCNGLREADSRCTLRTDTHLPNPRGRERGYQQHGRSRPLLPSQPRPVRGLRKQAP